MTTFHHCSTKILFYSMFFKGLLRLHIEVYRKKDLIILRRSSYVELQHPW